MATPAAGRRNRLLVAAFDIGTTFSGYAFSFRSDFNTDPQKIYTNDWSSDGAASPSLKAPSVILLKPDKSFDSFGYRAKKEYERLLDDPQNAKKYYFFKSLPSGIASDQMILAYEPECAALYCSVLPADQGILKYFQVGRTLMVVDLGGGTIDITVIKVVKKENKFTYLEHLYKVNGGPFGGNTVNKKFEDFLEQIIGKSITSEFKRNHYELYEDIMTDFEKQKKTIADDKGKTKLKLCGELRDLFKEENGVELRTRVEQVFPGEVQLKYDKLEIDNCIFKSFFRNCLENIKSKINNLLFHKEFGYISAMILVGGFSESLLISNNIKNAYSIKTDIVNPFGASLAVVKGAVIYGHDPSIVTGRICQETIGVALHHPYDKDVHLQEKTFKVGDQVRVDECFEKIFSVNQFIRVGQVQAVKVRDVLMDQDKESRRKSPKTIAVYCSNSPDPKYVSDPECHLKGQIKVHPPGGEWPNIVEGIIEFEAGGTELLVRYKDNTYNRVTEGRIIDFM